MNEYIKAAISKLIYAPNPRETVNVVSELNEIGQDFCVEIALEEYSRSLISNELVSLVNEPDSDLLSYFLNEHIYFADNEILEEMWKRKGDNYNFGIDYSVVLDTNYASYISDFITKPDNLNERIKNNLDVLIRNDFRFDYMIYIIENFYNVFHKEGINSEALRQNRANFYNNLLNLELFKNINVKKYVEQGIITFDIEKSEAYVLTDRLYNGLLNSQDSKDNMKEYFEIHKMMTLYIIGILKVRFSSNKAPHNKMNDMFDFMNEVAGLYFDREMKFTYDYFENPKKYRMFDKIYKNIDKSKLNQVIENIAWDFSIPRIIEKYFRYASTTRYFIPLILTHDSNMKTVFSAYKVKGVIFNKDKTIFAAFSNVNTLEYLEERKCKINYEYLFSNEASKRRKEVFENNRKDEFRVINSELDVLVKLLSNADM